MDSSSSESVDLEEHDELYKRTIYRDLLGTDYKMKNFIDSGVFGRVFSASLVNFPEITVAIKILSESDSTSSKEIMLLLHNKHSHIVKCLDWFKGEHKFYVVLEYLPNKTLLDLVMETPLSENETQKKFPQLISAVEYLHGHGICHRDIKLENILLDINMDWKLADFGFSKEITMDSDSFMKRHTRCGSVPYASPELLKSRNYNPFKSDLWSCGVVLYACLIGSLPFYSKNLQKMGELIMNCDVHFPKDIDLSKYVVHLIKSILTKELIRPSLYGIKDHPWMKNNTLSSELDSKSQAPIDIDKEIISVISTEFMMPTNEVVESIQDSDGYCRYLYHFLEKGDIGKQTCKMCKSFPDNVGVQSCFARFHTEENKANFTRLSQGDIFRHSEPQLIKHKPIQPNRSLTNNQLNTKRLSKKLKLKHIKNKVFKR